MEIKTKFNLGDIVYPIVKHGYNGIILCNLCEGKGGIKVNNTERVITCPDCYGRGGHKEWIPERWVISEDSIGFVGKIEVDFYEKKYTNYKNEIKYMLNTTGVGSGQNWHEESLFHTLKVAEQECEKRNTIEVLD